MIQLLPHKTETLILPYTWDVVLERLQKGITSPIGPIAPGITGWVKDDRFQVTQRIRRYNSFLPIVSGTIDPTSKGCLVFLEYSLFRANKMFLSFWMMLIFLGGIIVAYQYKNILLWIASLGIIAFIELIAWANFRLHLKPLRTNLLFILNGDSAGLSN